MTEAVYPFSAIVGQGEMKLALVLAAIHPGLGGVLIRGSKGAAKSTAVRALAALLPEVEVFEGDPFSRAEGEEIPGWPVPEGARRVRRPASLVNLPIGATDDRVVGSLDFESALTSGRRRFEPGLLASAHRGVLYIDEVNLLPDHLVDVLLDASAMGVNHVEREGVAFRHPSRFVLVGTMNPEEGELRPQLLDRFGLCVEAEAMDDPAMRAEAVRRRLAFDGEPAAFLSQWIESEEAERARIARGRALIASVLVPDEILAEICTLCAREGAEGLRADLAIHRAASARAAYEGRTVVTREDVQAVSELALAHRRTVPPRDPPPVPPVLEDPLRSGPPSPPRRDHGSGYHPGGGGPASEGRASGDVASEDRAPDGLSPASEPFRAHRPRLRIASARASRESARKGRGGARLRSGFTIGAERPIGRSSDPALAATLRAAAPLQAGRGRASGEPLILRASDLRDKVRESPARSLVLFVVDASRSMGARERIRATKAAVLSLLIDSYQRRDLVGLIAFGRGGASLLVPPTRSVRAASRGLQGLGIGGATPLASGLALVASVVAVERRRDPGIRPFVVLLTDGRGNLPLHPGGDPIAQAIEGARRLHREGVAGLVIDTESGPVRLGTARALAETWGADLRRLDELTGPRLPDAVRRAILGLAS